jgi:hypothetical protein
LGGAEMEDVVCRWPGTEGKANAGRGDSGRGNDTAL